jgi:hypothetical protein
MLTFGEFNHVLMNKQRKERKARYDRNVIYDIKAKRIDRKEIEYEKFLECVSANFDKNPYLTMGEVCAICGKTSQSVRSRKMVDPDFEKKWDDIMQCRQDTINDIKNARSNQALECILKGKVLEKRTDTFKRMLGANGLPACRENGAPHMELWESEIQYIGIEPDPKIVLEVIKQFEGSHKYSEKDTEDGGQIVTTFNVISRDVYNNRMNKLTNNETNS